MLYYAFKCLFVIKGDRCALFFFFSFMKHFGVRGLLSLVFAFFFELFMAVVMFL